MFLKSCLITIVERYSKEIDCVVRSEVGNMMFTIESKYEDRDIESDNCQKDKLVQLMLGRKRSISNFNEFTSRLEKSTSLPNLSATMIDNARNQVFALLLNQLRIDADSLREVKNDSLMNSIEFLDSTPVFYTYRVGIVFKSYEQADCRQRNVEHQIFNNKSKISEKFIEFLNGLGKLVAIDRKRNVFSGLNRHYNKYCIYKQDSLFQIVYNVLNLIGNSVEVDENKLFLERKKVIGNLSICVFFLESGDELFSSSVIKSFNIIYYIVVIPIGDFYRIKILKNKQNKMNVDLNISALFKDIVIDESQLAKTVERVVLTISMRVDYAKQKQQGQLFNEGEENHLEFETSIGNRLKALNLI